MLSQANDQYMVLIFLRWPCSPELGPGKHGTSLMLGQAVLRANDLSSCLSTPTFWRKSR